MPVIKSAQKRMRQEAKRRVRNREQKDELRARSKALHSAVAEDKKKAIQDALNAYYQQVDKMVKKNILHKNNGARKKAQAAKVAKGEAPIKAAKKPAKKAAVKKKAAKKPAAKTSGSKSTAKKKAPAKKSAAKKSSAKTSDK